MQTETKTNDKGEEAVVFSFRWPELPHMEPAQTSRFINNLRERAYRAFVGKDYDEAIRLCESGLALFASVDLNETDDYNGEVETSMRLATDTLYEYGVPAKIKRAHNELRAMPEAHMVQRLVDTIEEAMEDLSWFKANGFCRRQAKH